MPDIHRLTLPHIPQGARAYWCDIAKGGHGGIPLPPSLEQAADKRQNEFRAGRACARRALGFDHTIAIGKDRAPQWPAGHTGSITHCDRFAMAIAASGDQFAGLGIDIETPVPASEAKQLSPQICTADETALCAGTRWDGLGFTAIFSAKESLFKAVYPTVRRFVDFHEVTLRAVSDDRLVFALTRELAAETGREQIILSAEVWHDHVLTICALEHKHTPG